MIEELRVQLENAQRLLRQYRIENENLIERNAQLEEERKQYKEQIKQRDHVIRELSKS